MFKSISRRVITGSVVVAALIVAVFFSSSLLADPKVAWSPMNVSKTISAGDKKTVPVSLTSNGDLAVAYIHVVPELAPFVSVDPNSIDFLAAGETLNVSVSFSVPATELPGMLDGVLQVRSESNGRTLSKPLPIDLEIEWEQVTNEETGVTLEYPDFGKDSDVSFSQIYRGLSILEIMVRSSEDLVSQVVLSFMDNPELLSLSEWFSANVDLGGYLLATDTYVHEVLSNGIESLILAGPVPPEHGNSYGPVSFVYAISPDGSKVIAANRSHGNELALLGLDTKDQRLEYLINIVGSLSFE